MIEELKIVVKRKFPDKYPALDAFLRELPFEYVYTSDRIDTAKYPAIRDEKDFPILVSAIIENVDVLLTGDKDFSEIDIEHPKIMTPAQFLSNYSI